MDGQKPTLNDVAMYFDDAGIRSTKEDSYAATVRAAMEVMRRCESACVFFEEMSRGSVVEPHTKKLLADIRKLVGEESKGKVQE